jgi:hypothetical protein
MRGEVRVRIHRLKDKDRDKGRERVREVDLKGKRRRIWLVRLPFHAPCFQP